MSRPVLRRAQACARQWPAAGFARLPERLAPDSHTPDSASLLPADIILSTTDSIVSRSIRDIQRKRRYFVEHAEWSHVALFVGGGKRIDNARDPDGALVIEAVPGSGVRITTLIEHARDRDLLVRRDLAIGDDFEKRHRIVVAALAFLGQPYSFRAAANLGIEAYLDRASNALATPVAEQILCSNFVRSAYIKAGHDAAPGVIGNVWPADLSSSTKLTDIEVGWLRIGG